MAALQEATLNDAQLEAKKILDEAREHAEHFRKEEFAKAQGESDQFLERAKKEIALEEARARDSLKREVVDLTLQAASTVLGRSMTSDDDKRLAETVVSELQQRRVGAMDR
ncbi:MAG: ATP synthase F0 subunit B [Planctomycetota bacterium]